MSRVNRNGAFMKTHSTAKIAVIILFRWLWGVLHKELFSSLVKNNIWRGLRDTNGFYSLLIRSNENILDGQREHFHFPESWCRVYANPLLPIKTCINPYEFLIVFVVHLSDFWSIGLSTWPIPCAIASNTYKIWLGTNSSVSWQTVLNNFSLCLLGLHANNILGIIGIRF